MRIAINTRFLLPGKLEGFGWYTYEVSKRLAEQHPEHTFYFFFDRTFETRFVFAENVIPVVLHPQARHPVLFRIWFDRSVTRALKKYRIDLFFSPDGYLSLRTEVPQVAVIHDLNFEHYPQDLPNGALRYLKKFFPRFARKATRIVTVSDYSAGDICEQYGIERAKVVTAHNGASEMYRPLDEIDKVAIRQKYADGNDFFLFVGSLHPRKNLIRLLKAFEAYCEAGGTMNLVIVGENLWKRKKAVISVSETVKKRIFFTGYLDQDELVRVMAAAGIFVYVPYFEGFGIPLVEAMRCGVPIISGNRTSLPEVAGDAALYCDPFDVDDISEKMVQLADDRTMRAYLGKKGLERAEQFSWQFTADKVWEVISDVLKPEKD